MIDKNRRATVNHPTQSLAHYFERFFQLSAHQTSIRQECIAGFTTFVTVSYVIFVIPNLLVVTGMDKGAVFTATCLLSALSTALMGLWSNYPVVLAPGMGLNAFFAFGVCLGMGYSWEIAMGAVFWGSIAFMLLSLFKVRAWIINSIPHCLRIGISAGIGLFIALIGLKASGVIVPNTNTIVAMGAIRSLPVILAGIGCVLVLALAQRGIKACAAIAMIIITILAWGTHQVHYVGVFSLPPSIAPLWGHLDLMGSLNIEMFGVILAFFFVNLFDTTGTLLSVCDKAGLLDAQGKLPRLSKALTVDSAASVISSVAGVPTVTSYVESVAGVSVGGRTGLTALTTAGCFLIALFFSPLIHMVPSYATTGALVYVAVLMVGNLTRIPWDDLTEAGPAMVTAIMMPLSFSISTGIALGFIAYAAVKLLTSRYHEVSASIWILSLLFIAKFAFFGV